jgi:hypothetical protein
VRTAILDLGFKAVPHLSSPLAQDIFADKYILCLTDVLILFW